MRAATVFFTEGSPHELSLDQEVREFVLSNLEYNTHPDIVGLNHHQYCRTTNHVRFQFLSAYDEVYTLIETSSFPQFLIVQSMNINMPRRVACKIDIEVLGLQAVPSANLVPLPVS